MQHLSLFVATLGLLLLFSCRRAATNDRGPQKWSSAQSVDFNQEVSIREQLKIKTFLAHYTHLKMERTNSGLHYMIYQHGNLQQPMAKDGQQALVQLQIGLLDGSTCYQTKPDEIERITIAHSEKESGIHEALLLMRKGDKAKLILPSYLGHGLLGDRLKIPPQSILYIDIQLMELQ
jgi:FKBP-type peptidyl-prolyl cis-trans isomerase